MCILTNLLKVLNKQCEDNEQQMIRCSNENLVLALGYLTGRLMDPKKIPDVQKIIELFEQNKNITKTITSIEQILEKNNLNLVLSPGEQDFFDYIKKNSVLNEFCIKLKIIKAGFKKIYYPNTFCHIPEDTIFYCLLHRYSEQIDVHTKWWEYFIYQAREGSNQMRVLRGLNPVKMKTLSDSDKEKRDSILDSFRNKHLELFEKEKRLSFLKEELFEKLKQIEGIKKIVSFNYICSILGFKNDETRNHINDFYEKYADIFQKLQTDCDSFLLEMNQLIEQCNREYNTKDDILSLYNFCITNMFPFPGKPDDGEPVIPFPEILERDSDKEKWRKYIEYLVNRGFQGFHK